MDAKHEPQILGAMRIWAYVEHGHSNAAKAQKRKVSKMAFIVLYLVIVYNIFLLSNAGSQPKPN